MREKTEEAVPDRIKDMVKNHDNDVSAEVSAYRPESVLAFSMPDLHVASRVCIPPRGCALSNLKLPSRCNAKAAPAKQNCCKCVGVLAIKLQNTNTRC